MQLLDKPLLLQGGVIFDDRDGQFGDGLDDGTHSCAMSAILHVAVGIGCGKYLAGAGDVSENFAGRIGFAAMGALAPIK